MNFSRSRDLMVISRNAELSSELLQIETECLHKLLDNIEATPHLATCCEIINLARYRIETKREKVIKALQQRELQPFIFIFNKN